MSYREYTIYTEEYACDGVHVDVEVFTTTNKKKAYSKLEDLTAFSDEEYWLIETDENGEVIM